VGGRGVAVVVGGVVGVCVGVGEEVVVQEVMRMVRRKYRINRCFMFLLYRRERGEVKKLGATPVPTPLPQ
jgi:hypothetical protein